MNNKEKIRQLNIKDYLLNSAEGSFFHTWYNLDILGIYLNNKKLYIVDYEL